MDIDVTKMSDADIMQVDLSSLDFTEDGVHTESQDDMDEEQYNDEESNDTVSEESDEVDNESTEDEEEDNGTMDDKSIEPDNVNLEVDDGLSEDVLQGVNKLFKEGINVRGSTIKINTVEDLEKLLRNGVGANKRMQELKPKLKLIGMLESNNLTDPTQLNYLIDLAKNNPKAINKLLQESKYDPMDTLDSRDYVPSDYSIPDQQYNLQEVMDSISDLPKYSETISMVKNMDDRSRSMIGEQPQRLATLVQDNADGTFVQIKDIVVTEQAKGELRGMSFLEAYEYVTSVIKENLASNSGKSEAGHNNKGVSTRTSNNSAASPHNNTALQASNKKGSSGALSGNGSTGSRQQTSASAAAKKAAALGSHKGKARGTNVPNLSTLSDVDILKLPLTAFD